MDSLDEKQKAFEERQANRKEENSQAAVKAVDLENLNRQEKLIKEQQKKAQAEQPMLATVKFATFQHFLTAITTMAVQWRQSAQNEVAISPINSGTRIRAEVKLYCAGQLLNHIQQFTNKLNAESDEVQKLMKQAGLTHQMFNQTGVTQSKKGEKKHGSKRRGGNGKGRNKRAKH